MISEFASMIGWRRHIFSVMHVAVCTTLNAGAVECLTLVPVIHRYGHSGTCLLLGYVLITGFVAVQLSVCV